MCAKKEMQVLNGYYVAALGFVGMFFFHRGGMPYIPFLAPNYYFLYQKNLHSEYHQELG